MARARTRAAVERMERLAKEPFRSPAPAIGSENSQGVAGSSVRSIREIWEHRYLLDMLVRREVRARYKDSTLGLVWSLIKPIVQLLIYYVAIGKFLGAQRVITDFAIYVFIGLTVWQLFADCVTGGTGSIIANAGIVKKVYVPREVFPLSAIGAGLFNFAVQFGVLLIAAVALSSTGFNVDANLLYLPLALAVVLVWATAAALYLSAVNVFLRDIQYLVEVGLVTGFWASPLVYSWEQVSSNLPTWLSELYLANPITLAVFGFHKALWSAGAAHLSVPNLSLRLLIALGVGLLVLWLSQRRFLSVQGNFAQEL